MGHTQDECPQHLAARWWWEVARRDDLRVARRLDRQQAVDGVSRLDEGAGLEDCVHGLHVIGVLTLLEEAPGNAIPRQMGPWGPYVWRYGLQTGAYGPPRPGENGVDRATGNGGGGRDGADDL